MSDVLGAPVGGPIDQAAQDAVKTNTASPLIPPRPDVLRDFTSLLAAHYSEMVAFTRDVLSEL